MASEAELRAAQELRYRVFYEERHAAAADRTSRLDADVYDPVCDHLLVIDHTAGRVVGAYRLLRQVIADQHRGFYSSQEFDLRPLLNLTETEGTGQLLELGRSCVDPAYRNSATISMLWRGIASYLELHNIGFMFGCASFPGTEPDDHAAALSFLYQAHLAPPSLRVRALAAHHVEMNRLPPDRLDVRAAERSLPPLIRGYLRVGATVGDGAFVDRQFNTVDVFVVMPVDRIARRYAQRYVTAPGADSA